MDEVTKNSPCKECNGDLQAQLQAEVDHLRQHLADRNLHIVTLEEEYLKGSARIGELEEQVDTWREKYERLYDSHKRVQKLNQVLEDKLLQMVDKMKGEKSQLTKDIATLSVRLAESKHNYSMLQKENERYKNDMNLAIQLLQCKPDNFVSQKLDNLPVDTQARVSQYVMSKTSKASSAQSKNGNEPDTFDASEYEFNISASLMTKILEDSIHDSVTKHCDTCTCNKTQNKPFCYNESYYTVATQTNLTGDGNTPCSNCHEIKSVNSIVSARSASPQGIDINDKKLGLTGPLYVIPQPGDAHKDDAINEKLKNNYINENVIKLDDNKEECQNNLVTKPAEEKQLKKPSSVNMEPAVHHKLCDRTKNASMKSSHSIVHDDLLFKDSLPMNKEVKPRSEVQGDNASQRNNSQSSIGAVSRSSSIAKSTVSTHKSNTQVGPGPRFCHLRMQAGSKNILLDNAEPNVPPVLYRRQSKCNENELFKALNNLDNLMDLEKDDTKEDIVSNNNIVVESTLIDVHVDNNSKESPTVPKTTPLNPVLMNVSSSPLQPLKTHNFSNSSENNNNQLHNINSQQTTSALDNVLLNNFTTEVNAQSNNNNPDIPVNTLDVLTPTDEHQVKIFNFDRYEQSKVATQVPRTFNKLDMSQLHSIESTKISKDFPPRGTYMRFDKKLDAAKSALPAIVNVYPNLTQTHLKVNDHKKVFTNEKSTSSLSSDDSAAILQKQQLLRVAEWVEQNLEQQNNFNVPLEDEVSFHSRMSRRDNTLSRLTETLNELALNMPHPVSKYAKPYIRDIHNSWMNNNSNIGQEMPTASNQDIPVAHSKPVNNVTKETIFPVDSDDATVTETNDAAGKSEINDKNIRDAFKMNGDGDITAEDLARMEYNVKKFLLSGPYWTMPDTIPESTGRSRRTSSKTETDV